MDKSTVVITFRADRAVRRQLAALCSAERRRKSEMIRVLIQDAAKRIEKSDTQQPAQAA